jgi:hypothetical protein
MAINKRANNIRIKLRNNYTLVAGKLIKIADQMNIEATEGNLTLISNKKIVSQGNKQ